MREQGMVERDAKTSWETLVSKLCNLQLKQCFFAVLLLVLTPAGVPAFMQSLPDELTSRPEEEQLRWLNAEFEEAYTLQLKVAQERHEQRMGRLDAMAQTLADVAFQHEQLIAEAEEQTRLELEASARTANQAFGLTAFLLTIGAVMGWWMWGRRVTVVSESVAERRDDAHELLAKTLEKTSSRGGGQSPRGRS